MPARRTILALALLLPALPALAQAQQGQAEGEVRRIDRDQGKITIRHGPIDGLDMPGMTMVFRVQEAGLLDRAAVGDTVRFTVTRTGDAMVITALDKTR
jgi:Cu/Ag efflux protein CusF